jgi:hypothetical protein
MDDYYKLIPSVIEQDDGITIINGFVFEFSITRWEDGDITITLRPMEDTCWDGELPF